MTIVSLEVKAQNPVFDNLEMLYDQGHYRKVYRKTNRLLDNPEYDYSLMPKYYKSISILQLAQNDFWRKRNKGAMQNAKKMFYEIVETPVGQQLITAHIFELAKLKRDLTKWKFALKEEGNESLAEEVDNVILSLFDDIQQNIVKVEEEITKKEEQDEQPNEIEYSNVEVSRKKIVSDAKKHLGTPYKWSGNKPGGFDCSGFTSYVLAKSGKEIPRRSSDQYTKSQKVKRKNVQVGDLVFFSNGSGVSHVGIVTSKKGEPLQMIHSSSSKGIIITDVESSKYWQKRIYGYGTFVK